MVRKSVMAMSWAEALRKARKKYPNQKIVSLKPAAPVPKKYWIITKKKRKK